MVRLARKVGFSLALPGGESVRLTKTQTDIGPKPAGNVGGFGNKRKKIYFRV